jgi:hypothetical protein
VLVRTALSEARLPNWLCSLIEICQAVPIVRCFGYYLDSAFKKRLLRVESLPDGLVRQVFDLDQQAEQTRSPL